MACKQNPISQHLQLNPLSIDALTKTNSPTFDGAAVSLD
jgi:hypothetical protein